MLRSCARDMFARLGAAAVHRPARLLSRRRPISSSITPYRRLNSSLAAQAQVQDSTLPLAHGLTAIDEHRPAVSAVDNRLLLTLPDGSSTSFDNQFLRDHCRCSTCFHPQTKQRLVTLSDSSTGTTPASVEVLDNHVRIVWAGDSHVSTYPWSFLARAAYDPPLPSSSSPPRERSLWNAKIAVNPPTVSYDAVVATSASDAEEAERGVLRWLEKIDEFGFCFVEGVPPTPEATEALIRRISHIRQTHYGGFWDFTSDMSHGDLAYSTHALPAHTDTAYFTDPAGLQVFHMLAHTGGEGGTSLLVDGFYAADLLSVLHPEAYDTLARLRLPHHASGTPGTVLRPILGQPVLSLDAAGALVQLRWNNEDRGVVGTGGAGGWTADDVRAWYDAARKFGRLLQSEDAEYWVQLAPGTVVVIDNWRVMHGRSAFTGKRRMCGAYVGADDWGSRLTALRKRFTTRPVDEIWDVGW